MEVTILGAGAMGSALTFPLSDNGHIVNLWGTEFDNEIIDAISEGKPHPRLGTKMPSNVKVFYHNQLDKAMANSKIIVVGVISDGVGAITGRIASYMKEASIILTVSKGFNKTETGILTLPEVIRENLPKNLKGKIPIVAVGGPSLADELAQKLPTAVVYASKNLEAARVCQKAFRTSYYSVEITDDIVGVELCAALKNVYAIAVGWCDGLAKQKGVKTMTNAKSLLFTQAIEEMTAIVQAAGGKADTVTGLVGVGDLEVTCRGGRNGLFGEYLGAGLNSKEALEEMRRTGKGAVEGYPTTDRAHDLVKQLEKIDAKGLNKRIPLLLETYNVLYQNKQVTRAFDDFFKQA
jgi:glycerol-3-phosphate dehydrogenase (NAD(P)+)